MYDEELEQHFVSLNVELLVEGVISMFSIRNNSEAVYWINQNWVPIMSIDEVEKKQKVFTDNNLIASALRNYGDRAFSEKNMKYQLNFF